MSKVMGSPLLVTSQALSLAKSLSEEGDIQVAWREDGHSGPGVYAWITDYPDEGSLLLCRGADLADEVMRLRTERDAMLAELQRTRDDG